MSVHRTAPPSRKARLSRRAFISGAAVIGLAAVADRLGLTRFLTSCLTPDATNVVPPYVLSDITYPDGQTIQDITERALTVLRTNRKSGTALMQGTEYQYDYICPARPKYPHQWFWDSSFHAIVTSKVDPDLAVKEIDSLFQAMRPNGFMPNMILWEGCHGIECIGSRIFVTGMTSNITQPPVIAVALQEIFNSTRDRGIVERYLPLVKKHYEWLARERDPDDDGLVSVIHPWETGIDATPSFDSLLGLHGDKPCPVEFYAAVYGLLARYAAMQWDIGEVFATGAFDVEHVMFNCIYAEGLRSIARLSTLLGDGHAAQHYAQRADRVERAIVDVCWNDQHRIFFDVSSASGHEQLKVKTVSSLFPIILSNLDEELVHLLVNEHLLNADRFWLPFPVPSVSRDEPQFAAHDSPLLWRGPTWMNTNWFLVRGLASHGYEDVAREIARRSAALADQVGFSEFYDPLTGAGGGQQAYSWSTLVLDMLAHL
jgi:glycogen debranching enzyme